MTALNTFAFNGYILKPAGFEHLRLAEAWTSWDADHAGRVEPKFWIAQGEATDSYLLSDARSGIFFFRIDMETRETAEVHIQFMPCAHEEDRERTRAALLAGMFWLEAVLRGNGVKEIWFDSRDRKLIQFCIKRLEFEEWPSKGTVNGEFPQARLSKRL